MGDKIGKKLSRNRDKIEQKLGKTKAKNDAKSHPLCETNWCQIEQKFNCQEAKKWSNPANFMIILALNSDRFSLAGENSNRKILFYETKLKMLPSVQMEFSFLLGKDVRIFPSHLWLCYDSTDC